MKWSKLSSPVTANGRLHYIWFLKKTAIGDHAAITAAQMLKRSQIGTRDDLLVTSPDHKTHKKHLKILFKRLTEYGIIIGPGPDKCQFGTIELSFLGLRRYPGMLNYYHRFIPHWAEKLTPLNNLLTEANEGQIRLLPLILNYIGQRMRT